MELDRPGPRSPPTASTGTSSARTWCASSPASIPCRPTSASSCSAATVPASTRRRSRKGLQIVERQLRDRAVRSGEEELFKARARETGSVKLIDIISARLDAKTDSYLATLPSLQLKDVGIEDKLVSDNERMLTGGFYAEVDLTYDAVIAQEKNGRPFAIAALRPIQLSKRDVLDALYEGREPVHAPPSGSSFLLRSIGLEPTQPDRAAIGT